MNWIQFSGFEKFEVLEKFKNFKEVRNKWSSYSTYYYSIKIKCPSNIHFIGLKGKKFKDVIYKIDNVFYNAKFSISSIRGLSDNRDHKIIKLEVDALEVTEIKSQMILRDLKLSDLFTL